MDNRQLNHRQRVVIDTGIPIARKPSETLDGITIPLIYGIVKIEKGIPVWTGKIETVDRQASHRNPRSWDLKYVYALSSWIALCSGKSSIETLYSDGASISWTAGQFNDGTGSYFPTGLTDGNNTPFSPCYASKLSGIAHLTFVDTDKLKLNVDNKIANLQFVMKRDLSSSPVNSPVLYKADGITFTGNNPAGVIYDILTNKQFCLGIDSSYIDIDSFNSAADYFTSPDAKTYNRVYGLNLIIDSRVEARNIFDKIRECCDVLLYLDPSVNKFKLKLLYDRNASPIGSIIDNFKSFSIDTNSIEDVYNEFKGEYRDPDFQYEKRALCVRNQAAIDMAGGRVKTMNIDLTMFNDKDIASARLNEIMQRYSFPKITGNCEVDRSIYNCTQGDLVNIVNTEYGISETFRIVSVDFGKLSENNIVINFEQAFENLFDGNSVTVMASEGFAPHYIDPPDLENLKFPSFSGTSNARSAPFSDPAKAKVIWGDNQEQVGELVYTADNPPTGSNDFTIIDNGTFPKIVLNPVKWADSIQANYLGLLNVDTWQGS